MPTSIPICPLCIPPDVSCDDDHAKRAGGSVRFFIKACASCQEAYAPGMHNDERIAWGFSPATSEQALLASPAISDDADPVHTDHTSIEHNYHNNQSTKNNDEFAKDTNNHDSCDTNNRDESAKDTNKHKCNTNNNDESAKDTNDHDKCNTNNKEECAKDNEEFTNKDDTIADEFPNNDNTIADEFPNNDNTIADKDQHSNNTQTAQNRRLKRFYIRVCNDCGDEFLNSMTAEEKVAHGFPPESNSELNTVTDNDDTDRNAATHAADSQDHALNAGKRSSSNPPSGNDNHESPSVEENMNIGGGRRTSKRRRILIE
ncbi:hypothetical protein FOZ60_002089 [Perkinsus olseni]|uniref:Uncharacterized protein n=1 Tax=Perkinsus olseni TaxID=32597 RepID=A0A7J6NZX9_PEROL|nr:hypothetical protein FOZ60_002089 [Perkinsus olseni]